MSTFVGKRSKLVLSQCVLMSNKELWFWHHFHSCIWLVNYSHWCCSGKQINAHQCIMSITHVWLMFSLCYLSQHWWKHLQCAGQRKKSKCVFFNHHLICWASFSQLAQHEGGCRSFYCVAPSPRTLLLSQCSLKWDIAQVTYMQSLQGKFISFKKGWRRDLKFFS